MIVLVGCSRTPSTATTVCPESPSNVSSILEQPPLEPKIHFEQVAEEAGVKWVSFNGEEAGQYSILESLGTGCAISDFDRDGQLDIFAMGGGQFQGERQLISKPMTLFRQIGPWRFLSVQEQAGLPLPRFYHHGSFTADMDNDGYQDLLVTGYGGLQLFRNQGDGTFVDQTWACGLDDALWSTAAAWADLDQDGVLDLYVGHYVDWSFDHNPTCHESSNNQRDICGPPIFGGLPCSFFLANADGTFRNASHEFGIDLTGKTLGVVVADFDQDQSLEVYVANDADGNHLYRRQPNGRYQDTGLMNGVALGDMGEYDGSMGVDVGDLDGDGRLDIWVANFENQSFAFYRNAGNELFTHSSRVWGLNTLGRVAVGFGTVIFDVDGDGNLDIFCANGHVYKERPIDDRSQLPFLLWNDHERRFRNIADKSGDYFRQKHLGRGVACADLDCNGTLDLVITHLNSEVAILRNGTAISNWLALRLVGRESCRDAIGSQVTVEYGGRTRLAVIRGGGSYLSTSDQTIYFGLGDHEVVDRLEIRWPRGRSEVLLNVAANQKLIVVEKIPSSTTP